MSRPVVNLRTSIATFESLHVRANQGRGIWVKSRIARKVLVELLMDHSLMIETLRKHGYVAQGPDERSVKRVKLAKRVERVRLRYAD